MSGLHACNFIFTLCKNQRLKHRERAHVVGEKLKKKKQNRDNHTSPLFFTIYLNSDNIIMHGTDGLFPLDKNPKSIYSTIKDTRLCSSPTFPNSHLSFSTHTLPKIINGTYFAKKKTYRKITLKTILIHFPSLFQLILTKSCTNCRFVPLLLEERFKTHIPHLQNRAMHIMHYD